MTTTDGPAQPKYLRVAAAIRRQIADGALRPGQPAPSGAELSRATGFSTLTCRKALRALIADGLLMPGPSQNARPRVADLQAPGIERDLVDATRALSAGLTARRHALGLTQAELAVLAQVSVTTVGHAETGRTWQSRQFWERADAVLRASGDLLRLHDAYRAAGSPHQGQKPTAHSIERTVAPTHPLHAPYSMVGPPAGPSRAATAQATTAQATMAQAATALTRTAQVGPSQTGPSQVGPSRIVIVWTDGTVTTVHAPQVLADPLDVTFPDLER